MVTARVLALALAVFSASPAAAQEIYGGVYIHEVDTPFSKITEEGGVDFQIGYRFEPSTALSAIGNPAPYVTASINSQGYTSFAGAGLSWKLGDGPIYVRPGFGIVIHDGPKSRFNPVTLQHTELGSRVLFEPEIAIGTQLSDRLHIEASWVHISHARLFNSQQNPGIDMMGVRLTYVIR